MNIEESLLRKLYVADRLSSREISSRLGFSESKVNYWISKYKIPKRSISDAVYTRLNPEGDPFFAAKTISKDDAFLLGLGLGLFWGEGNKKDPVSVRLGNSDPDLIKIFLRFLEDRFQIKKHRLRFGLQVFSDMDYTTAEEFWIRYLNVDASQFYKTVVTVSGKVGSYREKTKYGVLTLYFHNKKLRDLIVGEIDKLRNIDYHSDVLIGNKKADVAQG